MSRSLHTPPAIIGQPVNWLPDPIQTTFKMEHNSGKPLVAVDAPPIPSGQFGGTRPTYHARHLVPDLAREDLDPVSVFFSSETRRYQVMASLIRPSPVRHGNANPLRVEDLGNPGRWAANQGHLTEEHASFAWLVGYAEKTVSGSG